MRRGLLIVLLLMGLARLAAGEPYMKYPLQKARRGTGFTTKYAFDFGKKNSTAREGFKPVTVETVLSDASEFGWRDAKEVKDYYARDNYKAKDFPVDVLYCAYQEAALNDLNDDALWGKSPAEFHVKLPPGTYCVYYLGGVPYRGGFPGSEYFKFDLSLNDKVKDTVCIPFSNMFENRRYTVEVGNEGLTVRLTPKTLWIVDGLIVYPAAESKDVEECLIAPLEEDVYLLPPYASEKGMRTIEKVAHEEPTPMPPLSPEQKEKGYLVFAHDWLDRVFPNTTPRKEEIGAPVALFATPGEWEPACFAVRALDRPCNVAEVRIAPPASKDGKTIPAENIRLYRVQYAWLAFGTGRGSTPGGTIKGTIAPYLLVKDIAGDVPPDTNQSYWLNIRIPDDAAPGVYDGLISIKPSGAPATDLPLKVRVLPFRLKTRPDFVYGVYWGPTWNYVKRKYKDPVMQEEGRWREADELRDFQEHMVQAFTYSYYTPWKVDAETKLVEPEDPTFAGMAEAVELRKRAGCTGPIIGSPVDTLFWKLEREVMKAERPQGMKYGAQWHRADVDVPPIALDLLEQGTRIVQEHVKKMNYPEFLHYVLDESDPKFMQRLYSAVKRVPGARTYTTSANFPEDIGPWIDVNCSTGSFLARGDWKGEIRERAERGEYEPWAYPNGCVMSYDGSPQRCRYVYGFYSWKMGLRGLCPWIYTTNNGKGNPFNDFDRDYPDTGFVMPGPDGVILTLRWDGAREGIDDMRYLYTLSTLLEEARKSQAPGVAALLAEAETSMKEMKDDVPETYMGEEPDLWTLHNTQAYRWYIATLIMRLQSALGTK